MVQEEKLSSSQVAVLIAIAYFFSLAVRYIWIDWASGFPEFFWNGQIMINTNDGYYFASAAQKELFGTLQHNPRVPDLWYTATITLTYYAAKLLPFSLDTVILYMPALVSSLVVVPMVMIGRLYGMTLVGFLSALLASVTWSYYNRTMAGYYDTDMFSAMAPMFIVYFLLAANHRKSVGYALAAALTLILYPFLYNQGKAMVFAISVLYIAYVWSVHRKEAFAYPSIALVAAAMLPVWWPWKILAVLGVFLLIRSRKLPPEKMAYLALGLSLVYLLMGDGFHFIYHRILTYAERDNTVQGLHFYNVVQTIREAGQIPFELLAKRISGSVAVFILAVVGYILLLGRLRAFVVTLPLMGLGLFAWWGGLRFTVYAVPMAALGFVFLFYIIAGYLRDRRLQYIFMAGVTLAALLPNLLHVLDYEVPTVFKKSEVKVLDRLKKIGSDKDYVIAWWDYGYPLWYYANKNTLIDGAKHNNDNFIVSEILTTDSQLEAARLARVAVETYVQSGYKTVADTLFRNGREDQLDPADYLKRLGEDKSMKLPPKGREVYLFLPYRMSRIFPTVSLFSEVDLKTGKKRERRIFYALYPLGKQGESLVLSGGVRFDMEQGVLHLGGKEASVKRFVTATRTKKGVEVRSEGLHPEGELTLVYLKSYNQFLLLNERMYRSLYVQLFFLRSYDPKLFEPVVESPWAMVYRIKI